MISTVKSLISKIPITIGIINLPPVIAPNDDLTDLANAQLSLQALNGVSNYQIIHICGLHDKKMLQN